MGDLCGLLQDLGEKIANKGGLGSDSSSSASTQQQHQQQASQQEEDPVETRFRTVIPNLLTSYFIPSKVKEREFTAILKLVCHTVKNYPGVFYHGKGCAVLPILGQIYPFFAEPAISGCLSTLYDSVSSLLSLLKAGEQDTYRNFFAGATVLIEDLASVAPFFDVGSLSTETIAVSVKCFSGVYSVLDVTADTPFTKLACCWRPVDGPGLTIGVSEKTRWQLLSEWTLKLLQRLLLVEGAMHVEGLITTTFLSAIGSLLSFGSNVLQKTCFEFLNAVIPVIDIEVVPSENFILSIVTILTADAQSQLFRDEAFDSAIGTCLSLLLNLMQKENIELIAQDLLEISPRSFLNSESRELKVAICLAFEQTVKYCSPLYWKIDSIFELIFLPEITDYACKCVQYLVGALDLEKVAKEIAILDKDRDKSGADIEKQQELAQDQNVSTILGKRKALAGFSMITTQWKHCTMEKNCAPVILKEICDSKVTYDTSASCLILEKEKSKCACSLHFLLLDVIGKIHPSSLGGDGLHSESMLSALAVLACVFPSGSGSVYHHQLVQQMQLWIPWVQTKAQNGSISLQQLSLFLKGLEKLLNNKDLDTEFGSSEILHDMFDILQFPWSMVSSIEKVEQSTKYRAVHLAMELGKNHKEMVDFRPVYVAALRDKDARVRQECIARLPDVASYLQQQKRAELFELFGEMCLDGSPVVREALARALGWMICVCDRKCQSKNSEFSTIYSCPTCSLDKIDRGKSSDVASGTEQKSFSSHLMRLFFTKLLFEEESHKVQVAFVMSMPSMLVHASPIDLLEMKDEWLRCFDDLPSHPQNAVRNAFSCQIHYFFHASVLQGLFGEDPDADYASKELQLLGKLKHALAKAEIPDVLEDLLETVAQVVLSACDRQQLFFFAFVLLLEQLDSKHTSVQYTSARLLRKCLAVKGRMEIMVHMIQPELYEYLSGRLVTRPLIVQNFSGEVLGIKMVDLVRQMVPIALPKLVIQQQGNTDAFDNLLELARQQDMELPLLLLEWCHKVFSVLLLKADGKELMTALQFYEAQTGSDTRELFSAVLPALLDELVWFLGDTGTNDATRRSSRVVPMIEEVACIVSGSDDVSGFLKTHFVGLLNSIDCKMLKAADVALQKQGLRCIDQLMELIGCHLSAFVPKIMVLLTRALQEHSVRYECLNVLLSFIQKLANTSPNNVKGVASQIVVLVMPYLEDEEKDVLHAVTEVLKELLLENGTLLEEQISELPLLPSLPELANLNAFLQKARGARRLGDQVRKSAEQLLHEKINIRLMASVELKKLVKSKRQDIFAMLSGDSGFDVSALSQLVMSLMQGCGESSRTPISERFKLSCAECLGELGAVDPVKLNIKFCARSEIERSDDDLIFELIDKHLVRVVRAAGETDVQDAAVLAIQELLKLSGCQAACIGSSMGSLSMSFRKGDYVDNELIEQGEKLWNRFSDDIKDIITPCLTSKYLLKHSVVPIPSGSIFRPGMSFRRWIYLWVRRLVLLSTGPRSCIFNACLGLLRHDMATVLYLLPYVVLNVVCNGTPDARASVTDEILSVLAEAASGEVGALRVSNGQEGFTTQTRSWSGPNEVSIQAVFTLLDNLAQWMDENKHLHILEAATGKQGSQPSQLQVSQYSHVSQLLDAIPKTALADASFRCQAYARSLLYFESHVRAKSGALNPASEKSGFFDDDDVSFLLSVYSGLDEPDGLYGLSRLHKSVSLQDKILINEKAGNWAEALTCCEQALQMNPKSVQSHFGVLNCLLNMGHLQAMAIHVDGLLLRYPEYKKEWSMWGVQAAWRLGQWDLLDEYLSGATCGESGSAADGNDVFDISLAKVLQALHKKDNYAFSKCLIQARHALLVSLAAASMESYSRAYPLIVKLHMLHELENFQDTLLGNELLPLADKLQEMQATWESRIRITQPSLWAREPILALRRVILTASKMDSESGECWLEYAKLCRAAGHHETASRAILEAQSAGARNVHIELAKLLWDTKRGHCAIAELQQALSKAPAHVLGSAREAALGGLWHIPLEQIGAAVTQLGKNENMDTAKALLLLARWVHCTGQKQKEEVMSIYTLVKELQPTWEKGYFFLAKYLDDLLVDAKKRQEEALEHVTDKSGKKRPISTLPMVDDKPWWTYLPEVLLNYAKGLHKGHNHLFQALPRLLTLWFEFGSSFHGEALSSNALVKATHTRVMSILRGCLKDLPSYQWLTVLPQLVSRICHHNDEVVRLVKHIIVSVLQAYPQQALWSMAAVSKSTVPSRHKAASEIIHSARSNACHHTDQALFSQFTGLIEQLIKLCFHEGPSKVRTLSLSGELSVLKRMMPVGVMVPIQRGLTVTLPANGLTHPEYSPFSAGDFPTISGIADEIEVLASLQRPKKVVLYGSDGSMHPFLCKPKDDLRKDSRMMEFTTTINRLLSKDPKSRRRKLYIRTFAVIPLTEDCGMVEWVLHTRGLRHILQDLYALCGKFDRQKTNPTIKHMYDQNKGKVSEVTLFQTKLLPMFPPVFHKWFLNTFYEPANWFQSRIAYAHTTAVWSMVGHIVGLGDRHGENILFDSTTGDCVHVDFSCLFDKGLQLEKPELVPFRLTQNIVDGLGITGYEGMFSRVCEITLSVLRANHETLVNVLETFIHDPLVEWTKIHKSSGVEVKNPHAQRAISNIKARLQGVAVGVGAAPSLPLSVEGQAHQLIMEAVSHENLGRMYIWWMPWF